MRQRGQRHGLQPVQVEALLYLARCNRYSDTPQAVTSYLSATKGTVSQTLKVLERQGLLTKATDSKDRRIVRLRLTPKGRRLSRKLAVPELLSEALSGNHRQEEILAKELGELLTALQKASGQQSFGVCRTCRYFQRETGGFRCGITLEVLSAADSELICREHEHPAESN